MAYIWSNCSDLTRVPGPPDQEVAEEGELGRLFFFEYLVNIWEAKHIRIERLIGMFNSGLPEPAERPHSSIAHA